MVALGRKQWERLGVCQVRHDGGARSPARTIQVGPPVRGLVYQEWLLMSEAPGHVSHRRDDEAEETGRPGDGRGIIDN